MCNLGDPMSLRHPVAMNAAMNADHSRIAQCKEAEKEGGGGRYYVQADKHRVPTFPRGLRAF